MSRSRSFIAADRARAQTVADEASAAASLRTLNTALVTYTVMFGRGFPSALGDLGAARGAPPGPTAVGLVDAALAGGTKNGYPFAYSPGGRNGASIATYYEIQANPIEPGHRFFFTDQTGIIRVNGSQPAGRGDPPM